MKSFLEQTDIIRQKGRRWRRMRNITFLVLFFGLLVWGWISYYYPYSTGTVTGALNQLVPMGTVFKTYEGIFIEYEITSSDEEKDIQTTEFDFSIAKKRIAVQLAQSGGKTVELHYTEYFKAIPWRGSSRFVVDKIIRISDNKDVDEIEIVPEGTYVIIRNEPKR